MTSRLITPQEFAELSTLSEGTLANMRRDGVGPQARRISRRRWAYVESEVLAYLGLEEPPAVAS